ncbi:MAG: hypothetical protein KAI07_00640 [Deltaproteobacteria bacterium]|nr:hypothetical protein [Deltaproteobacteria bacterium]
MTENKKNPSGTKYDHGKEQWDLLPLNLLTGLVKVLTFGAWKYCRNGWQSVPDAENRYFSALMRHLSAYQSGERYDKESGLNHLAHAMCNLVFLTYFDEIEETLEEARESLNEVQRKDLNKALDQFDIRRT